MDRQPEPVWDVAIAGAGPAGGAAAIRAAEAGLSVLLVDRQDFPRDKVCGDFLSPLAVRQLELLGITEDDAFARSNEVGEAAVFIDGEHLLTSAIPTSPELPPSRVVPRKALDSWVLKRAESAGATIRQGCRMMSFTVGGSGVRISLQDREGAHTVRARLLIGADGSNSAVARLLRGRPPGDDDRVVAVRGYFDGISGPADRADLYFSSESFPGYCWLFPVGPSSANVGLGILRNTLPPTRKHLREHLLELLETDSALAGRLRGARLVGSIGGWALTTYNRAEPITGDRILLVGDAAGLINPLNGEGIQSALLSGMWAGETALACARDDDFSEAALDSYAERIDSELGRDFDVSRALVQLIRNRALNPLWLEALRTIVKRAAVDPEYARVTGGVLAGVIPTREILGLAVMRKTLAQAAAGSVTTAVREAPTSANALLSAGIGISGYALGLGSALLRDRAGSETWAANAVTTARDALVRTRPGDPARMRGAADQPATPLKSDPQEVHDG